MDTSPLMDDMLTMLPPPARRIAGYHRLRPQEYALGVDCHDVVPVVAGGFLNVLAEDDGGVVHQHVHLAEPLLGGVNRPLPVILAGNVQMQINRLAAQLADFRLHLHTLVIQHVADDHFGPFLSEHPRLGGALPPRPAGNNRNLAFQPHRVSS